MKKGIAILLAALMVFGNISFALTFKDVPQTYWGYTFINEVAEKGIVTGYSDGTFQPEASISKYASVVMIYRALRVSNLIPTNAVATYRAKHAATLTTYDVPDWTDLKDAVSYFLEVGVLSIADLKNFTDMGKLLNASRQDVAIFLGRALNLHLKVATTQMNSLNFKDSALISTAATPYVWILNTKQIISGDTQGYFRPHDPVTRAQMAKMTSLSLKTLTGIGQTTEKMAVVKMILKDTKKVVFYDQANTSLTYIETIVSPVKVMSGSTEKTFDALALDQVVKLVYQGGVLSRVELTASNQNVVGEIKNVITLADRVILSVSTTTDSRTLIVTGTTPVTLNGVPDTYSNLMIGHTVVATMNGDEVVKLDYQKASTSYDGIISQAVTVVTVPIIKIRVGTEEKTYEFADNAVIKRNTAKVTMADLVAGDVVTFKVSLGKITEITALSTKTSVSGTIQELVISNAPTIKIKTDSGILETYAVSPNATVELDDKTVTLYDLRAEYSITAKIESNQITAIEAETVIRKSTLIGTVVNVYSDLKVFTVKDSAGKTYTVHVQDATLFITDRGVKDDLDMVDPGDYVFVYGSLNDVMMIADKVMELE